MKKEDAKAAFLILQLAEQGRFEATIAQMIASNIVASDITLDDVVSMIADIAGRTAGLVNDEDKIWDGLLPGPPSEYRFDVIDAERLNELERAELVVTMILEAGEDDGSLDGDFIESVNQALKQEGFITEPDPVAIDYSYTVSIIPNPHIKFDAGEGNKVLYDAFKVEAESPLNIWKDVLPKMENVSMLRRWPEEEMVAWITHPVTDKHWIMTWDQAKALEAYDQFTDALQRASFDDGWGGLEDFIQGISDMMSIAGDEYIAGKR